MHELITLIPVSQLRCDSWEHELDPEQLRKAAADLAEHGFRTPILVADDMSVLAGRVRVAAARMLGMEYAPCLLESSVTEYFNRAAAD